MSSLDSYKGAQQSKSTVPVERLIDFASNDNIADKDDEYNGSDSNDEERFEGDMPRVEEIDLESSTNGSDRKPLLRDTDDNIEPPTIGFRGSHRRHAHNGSIGSASDLGSHTGKINYLISR